MPYFSRQTVDHRSNPGKRRRALSSFIALVLCSGTLVACSDGEVGFSGFGGKGELINTELGQGYVDGPTTTIVAPPGADAGDGNSDGSSNSGDSGEPATATSAKDSDSKKSGWRDFFGLGRDKKADLSHLTPESVGGICQNDVGCNVDYRDIDHPTWGPTRIFLPSYENAGSSFYTVGLIAVDASGTQRWQYAFISGYGQPRFAAQEPDASGALYVHDNLAGLIILRPIQGGFKSLPDCCGMNVGLDDKSVYVSDGELLELDENGNYLIEAPSESGASGSKRILQWNGSELVEK